MDSSDSKQDDGSKSSKSAKPSNKEGEGRRDDVNSRVKDFADKKIDEYPPKGASRDSGSREAGRKGNNDRRKDPPTLKSGSKKGGYDGAGDYRESRDKYDDYYDRRSSGQGRPPPDRGDRRVDTRKSGFTGKSEKMDKNSNFSSGANRQKDVKTPSKVEQDKKAQKEKEEEDRKKKEEEKKKKEEERKKKEEEEKQLAEQKQQEEEERKRREEEENKRLAAEREQQKLEDEKKTLKDYRTELCDKLTARQTLREKNIAAAENRPDESFFSKLDSSLKKNTAFVKRLRNLTESQFEGLMKDFAGLNLTKYVGEAASALADVKLKMSDVQSAVQLSSLMHQRYAEFSPALLENFQKYLLNKKDEKISNPSKYRVDLRFFAELVSVGVFTLKEGLPVLANQLSILINNDKEEHNNLSIITSFCKHCGDDYVGILPRKIRLLSEKHQEKDFKKSDLLPPERQRACQNLLKDYSSSLRKHLIKEHKELKAMERQNRRIIQTKGELSNERRETHESSFSAYQKLHSSATVLADLLDEDLPDLPEEDLKQEEASGMFDFFSPMKGGEGQYEGDTALFEDEDTRTFYESLPDLRSFIPGILYKDSEQSATKDTNKEAEPILEDVDLECLEVELEEEFEEKLVITEGDGGGEPKEAAADDTETVASKDEDTTEERSFIPPEAEDDDGETGSLMKTQFEAYLVSLPNCVNRDLIDKAAIEFCMNFNTKSNRRKLVRGLFTVHRTRYDLLPFYARLVAILYPCMPDVANDLVQYLKGDFKWHVKKKDQINIESKLKTVRFLGELVKFKMCPKAEVLHCLKMLMFDFSHHNIEMACALLEACGRFLYRSLDSHHRTKAYLDVMMRKKAALHLDSRYTTMIENAYFYSNPPEYQQVGRKERPPMHEYIRKLLYKDLSKVTTEKVLRQMRKLAWDDTDIAFYTTKCLTAVWNIRYNSVHCAANLLAGLAPYHEHVAIQVVDGVLEDIRLGMEVNHPKYNQRRVSCVKFLGELYNYRMVESAVIFKTLYSFITFGVDMEEGAVNPFDPPEHLFRVRLVCVLLETCGQYFEKGSSKKKLDCFLVYFQRYYWYKLKNSIWNEHRPFPLDVKNMVKDTLEIIRPKLKLCESWEEAVKAAEDIENEYKTKIAPLLPVFETSDEGEVTEEEGLTPIQEADEDFDDMNQSLSLSQFDEVGSETSQDDQSGQSRSHTGSQNLSQNVDGDEESDDSDRDEFMESAGEDETEDQITLVTGAPKRIPCAEDDDFMAAFDKMMSENIQARTQESLKVPQLDIAMPVQVRNKTKKTIPRTGTGVTQPIPAIDTAVNFVLMTRKGNKAQFTDLNVPISAEFAAKFKEREQAEKLEKEKMKQVVLGIQQRQEEEDYQEMMASLNRPVPINTNRERRIRYSHPKGAPDADLIFGSK